MKQQRNNVSVPERIARILGGGFVAGAAAYFLLGGSSLWLSGMEVAAIFLGLDFIYTGLTGYCPLYRKLGLSTARGTSSRSAANFSASNSQPASNESAEYAKVSIPVIAFTCGGGGSLTLERSIKRLPGVRSVYVNPATETAYIEFSVTETTVDQIAESIRAAGSETQAPAPIQ